MKKRILGVIFALFATGLFFAQDDMPISKKRHAFFCAEKCDKILW